MHRGIRLRRGTQAFTLVELLVVIAIIIILSGLVLVAMMSMYDSTERVKARGIIDRLYTALETYKLQYGDYPPESGGKLKKAEHLDPLVDMGVFSYDQADLSAGTDAVLQDPWKQPYIYLYSTSAGSNIDDAVGHPVKIYSCGKKNYSTTDVTNPKYCLNWTDPEEGIVLPIFKKSGE